MWSRRYRQPRPPTPDADEEHAAEAVTGGPSNSALVRAATAAPQDPPYLGEMERRFGTTLRGVPTYLGQQRALRGVGTAATRDEAMWFADARPSRAAVAHELTHVLQQRRSGGSSTAADAEREARTMGARVGDGPAAATPPVAAGVRAGATLAWNPFEAIGDALDVRTDEARLDALEELADFRAQSFAPLTNHRPASGRGLFDVEFDAATGQMTVTVKVSYDFVDGNPAEVAPGFRAEEFKWASIGLGMFSWGYEADAWKARFAAELAAAWSGQYQFRSTKPFWTTMLVDVTVQVVEDAGSPHYELTIGKYPADADMVGSAVSIPPAVGPSSADFDSNDLRGEQKLDWTNAVTAVPFTKGGAILTAAGRAALVPIVAQLTSTPAARVELTGRASNDHQPGVMPAQGAIDNMDLARSRTAAVHDHLLLQGISPDRIAVRNTGEQGAGPGVEWCRVDAQIGTQDLQTPALHEMGHILGSADEYDNAANPPGTAVAAAYQGMITAQTGDVVTRLDNDSMMSLGSTVQRWNYAAFLEALKDISGTGDWSQ